MCTEIDVQVTSLLCLLAASCRGKEVGQQCAIDLHIRVNVTVKKKCSFIVVGMEWTGSYLGHVTSPDNIYLTSAHQELKKQLPVPV